MGTYNGKTCRLLTMLGMTSLFFLVEIIVGYITNSVALVANSFHMLSDVVALTVGVASVRISKWQSEKNTFGWALAEVVGALVNAVFLIALCFTILVKALKRLVEIEKIGNPKLLFIVGSAALLIDFLGLVLFHKHGRGEGGGNGRSHEIGYSQGGSDESGTNQKESESLVESKAGNGGENGNSSSSEPGLEEVYIRFDENEVSSSAHLNMRAVFLHVLGDALNSLIVMVSALIVWFVDKDWVYYVDPGMSMIMVCIILSTTIPLLKEAALILLLTVPTHIQVTDIKEKMMNLDGIEAVHELHVWQLAGNRVIASAHIRCHNPHEYMTLAGKIKYIFHNEGIYSITIQPEFLEKMSLTAEQVKQFQDNGYLILPDFADEATVDSLKTECYRLVEEMDPAEHNTVFTTLEMKRTSDDYFMTSGDKIRFFFEDGSKDEKGGLKVNKHLSINKIGHALHELSDPFKQFTFSPKVKGIAKSLGFVDPVICQSMYIFKQPGIGGEVIPHQDSTFLYTSPQRLMGMWIALEDATLENGCLWFIPGSHKCGIHGNRRMIRNPKKGEGESGTTFTGEQETYDPETFVAGPVKKGTMVLIHGEVVHKSEKNLSQNSRHIYTFHLFDQHETEYSKENWLQPTEKMPFPHLYT